MFAVFQHCTFPVPPVSTLKQRCEYLMFYQRPLLILVPLYPDGYTPIRYTEHVYITTHLKDKLCPSGFSRTQKVFVQITQNAICTIFGNDRQVYTSKCFPGSCSWATGPEKTSMAFTDSALAILRMMFHLFK